MSFFADIVPSDVLSLRQRLLDHPLWVGIEQGSVTTAQLRCFALQDWWLVREAYRLDALAIASAPDLETQELLISRLQPKVGGYRHLWRFGQAFGLTEADFAAVEPLAGCMALTTFFYWMLAYGSPGEKIAAVGASEDIFIQICRRLGPALQRNYGLSADEVAFFTLHEPLGERVLPIEQRVLARYQSPEEQLLLARAVRLSHEFELLFYDTVFAAK
jgi:thiaminase/transcriptional activator TenA